MLNQSNNSLEPPSLAPGVRDCTCRSGSTVSALLDPRKLSPSPSPRYAGHTKTARAVGSIPSDFLNRLTSLPEGNAAVPQSPLASAQTSTPNSHCAARLTRRRAVWAVFTSAGALTVPWCFPSPERLPDICI